VEKSIVEIAELWEMIGKETISDGIHSRIHWASETYSSSHPDEKLMKQRRKHLPPAPVFALDTDWVKIKHVRIKLQWQTQ
jgi:hypothetical protein